VNERASDIPRWEDYAVSAFSEAIKSRKPERRPGSTRGARTSASARSRPGSNLRRKNVVIARSRAGSNLRRKNVASAREQARPNSRKKHVAIARSRPAQICGGRTSQARGGRPSKNKRWKSVANATSSDYAGRSILSNRIERPITFSASRKGPP